MQSRGFFAARRSTDDGSRLNATNIGHRSNGDVINNDRRSCANRLDRQNDARQENHHRRYARRTGRNHREGGSVCPKSVHRQERSTDANQADDDAGMHPRRVRQRDYTDPYEPDRSSAWRNGPSDLNATKPIARNGISHGSGERLYSSTLPRRSRTINFRDQTRKSLESSRGYPKSLQDLSDLELDDRIQEPASLLSSNNRVWRSDRLDDVYRRRRYREDELEDDYLRLYRNLSRLDKYTQGGRYEPGQVHYERECRTFGKDTVAFIYYKTCYL